jgi:hypothetical protein
MTMKSIRERLNACNVDKEVLDQSRVARAGLRLIQFSVILRVIEPMLMIAATLMLISAPAFAQGSIFGQNDQTVGNSLKEGIRWGRNMLFLIGIGGVGWGVFNIMTEKPWMKQMIGGGLSMSVGSVMALIQTLSGGNAVNVDTDLGN